MKLPDIQIYKTDLTGKNPENLVEREFYERTAGDVDLIVAMKKGYFYHDSLVLLKPDGSELKRGIHYEFFGISKKITEFTKDKAVGLFIRLTDPTISQWYATYQVVGNFSIINQEIMQYLETALNDDRPVFFRNIRDFPKWVPPIKHVHDLRYEIHSFQELVTQIKRINDVRDMVPDTNHTAVEQFYTAINVYIADFKAKLKKLVDNHDGEKVAPFTNAHGLTALQMGLDKVDNFATADLMDVLEGIRLDLHITADVAAQAIKQFSKESDQLLKKGLLPIIRYGSNNFIPPAISGSFEGMGGTDFAMACGQESDGTFLMLVPRNDGRSSGLYFMRNLNQNAAIGSWEFTSYKYVHPKAVADGVPLTNVVKGSNHKFMIIGSGTDFYWTYGNDTFNPAKHQLNKLPPYVFKGPNPRVNWTSSYVITSSYPDKIYLLTYLSNAEVYDDVGNGLNAIGFSSGEGFGPSSTAGPRNGAFMGYQMWELDVATNTWRSVIFNYTQANDDAPISHFAFIPFKYKFVKGYPRADGDEGADYSQTWSLVEARFKFTKGINQWQERFYMTPVNKYDPINKRLGIKFFSSGYGQDRRSGTFEGTTGSFGASFENFKTEGDTVTCTVKNGFAMVTPNVIDTEILGNRPVIQTFRDNLPAGYSGQMGIGMIKDGILYQYCTAIYGTLPARIAIMDMRGNPYWEDYDTFYKNSFIDGNISGSSGRYNEQNPLKLSIGMHSEFYMLPSSNYLEYGVVGLLNLAGVRSNLVYRKTQALDSAKSKKAPPSMFNIYNTPTEGYPLSNDVRFIIEDYFLSFTTVVLNTDSKYKDKFLKNILSHSTYRRASNAGTITPANANHIYYKDVQFVMGSEMTLNILKQIDMEKVVKNVMIPKIVADAAVTHPLVSFANASARYSITPVCLESDTLSDMLLFTVMGMDPTVGGLRSFTIAFRITGETKLTDTTYEATSVAFIGSTLQIYSGLVSASQISRYTTEGQTIDTSRSVDNVAPRNLVIQQKDKSSVVAINTCYVFNTVGNINRPGILLHVTEAGVINGADWGQYWTSGEYRYFPHPYYGVGSRIQPTGAVSVGNAYTQSDTNDFVSIRDKKYAAGKIFMGISNYIEGAFTIYFTSNQPVTVGGVEYTLNSGLVDLFDIDPLPQNKTFYCYLSYVDGSVEYVVTASPMADNYSRALLATVTTNNDGIVSIRSNNVFTLDGYRIGAERHGATIPSATGTITGNGQTAGWADNDLDLS